MELGLCKATPTVCIWSADRTLQNVEDDGGLALRSPSFEISPARDAGGRCFLIGLELTRFRGYFPSYGERIHHGKRRTYPPEFRRKVLELARSGRSLSDLSREFEVARQSIVNWLKPDDLDTGRRTDGMTTEEHKELVHLRRENKRLKMEAEILSKAAAWFARETNAIPTKSSNS